MKYAIDELKHSVLYGKKYGFTEAVNALEKIEKIEVKMDVIEFLNERLQSVTEGLKGWINIGSEEHKRQLKRKKELEEAIDFLTDVKYLMAKSKIANDLYADGNITRTECFRHEVDLICGKDTGIINFN